MADAIIAAQKNNSPKSLVIFDIKPFQLETDLEKVAENIKSSIVIKGLKWG